MWAGTLSASSNVIFSSAVFTVQGLFRSTRQKQRSRPNPSKWIFQGGFREAQVICLQRGFQSGIDLAIHENSRKENPGFKSRRIIILPCTFAKPWARVRRKMGFSSTGKAEQGTAEEFQPLSCTIRYGFGQIPQNVFLPHRQHSYLLGWDSGEPRCAAGWQAAGSQLLCLLRHLQGGWARYSMQVTTRQGPGAPSTTTVAATRANLPHSNHRQGRPQR